MLISSHSPTHSTLIYLALNWKARFIIGLTSHISTLGIARRLEAKDRQVCLIKSEARDWQVCFIGALMNPMSHNSTLGIVRWSDRLWGRSQNGRTWVEPNINHKCTAYPRSRMDQHWHVYSDTINATGQRCLASNEQRVQAASILFINWVPVKKREDLILGSLSQSCPILTLSGEECCILERDRERRPRTIVNFTISIIPEMCRKIVHKDFELDWVTCVFTIECR